MTREKKVVRRLAWGDGRLLSNEKEGLLSVMAVALRQHDFLALVDVDTLLRIADAASREVVPSLVAGLSVLDGVDADIDGAAGEVVGHFKVLRHDAAGLLLAARHVAVAVRGIDRAFERVGLSGGDVERVGAEPDGVAAVARAGVSDGVVGGGAERVDLVGVRA